MKYGWGERREEEEEEDVNGSAINGNFRVRGDEKDMRE